MYNKIKARLNKDELTQCNVCNATQQQSLDMFDIMLGKTRITLCDRCVDALFNKTLKAVMVTQSRVKSNKDLAIIRKRGVRGAIYKQQESKNH